MAAVTERGNDGAPSSVAWHQRPVVGTSAGLPWWGAVLLGFGLTLFAAAVDRQLNDDPSRLFDVVYIVACVAAVCLVRRRNLFAPAVQPPLLLAVVLPSHAIYENGWPNEISVRELALTYGLPVINTFPVMAVATALTVLIAIGRLLLQRDPARRRRRGRRDLSPSPRSRSSAAADDRHGDDLDDLDDLDDVAGGQRANAARTAAAAPAVEDDPADEVADAPTRKVPPVRRRPAGRVTGRRPAPDEPIDPGHYGQLPQQQQPGDNRRRRTAGLNADDPPPRRRPSDAGDPPPRRRRPVDGPPPRRRRPERPWEIEQSGDQPPRGHRAAPPPQPPRRRPAPPDDETEPDGRRPRRRRPDDEPPRRRRPE